MIVCEEINFNGVLIKLSIVVYQQCWAVTSYCNLVTVIILLFAVTSSVTITNKISVIILQLPSINILVTKLLLMPHPAHLKSNNQIISRFIFIIFTTRTWSEHCCVSCGFTLLWHYIPLISMWYIILLELKNIFGKLNSFLTNYVIW